MPLIDGIVGPVPPGRDPDEYDRSRRRVLWSLPTGLFVVGSRAGVRRNLMTANWVMQIATSPKLVAVSVERGSLTLSLIEEGGAFSISVLSRADKALVRKFVKPVSDVELAADGSVSTMAGVPVVETPEGPPRLTAALSWLACAVRRVDRWQDEWGGGPTSHALVVGQVTNAAEGRAGPGSTGGESDPGVLRMEDTRMNYGG
jgi:flavin reductase (DIM6/NTAB) family NADH-FMN oxidoreductase RutF